MSAWRSASVRSGGFIFMRVSRPRTACSVRTQVVRRGLAGDLHAGRLGRRDHLDRLRAATGAGCGCARPRSAASAQSRATMVDSLTLGMPAMPSSALTSPSCMAPRPLSAGSSSCSASSPPARRWYCSALRIIPAETIGLPSSVKAMAPSSRSSAISVSSSPRRPLVIEAVKADGHARVAHGGVAQGPQHGRAVDHRIGVRHRHHRAEAARRGGAGPGLEVLLVLLAGHAQVHVRVDEGRQDMAPGAVDDLGALGHVGAARGRELDQRAHRGRRGRRRRRSPSRGSRTWTPRRTSARGGDGGPYERHAGAGSGSGSPTRAVGCAVITS